MNRVLLDQGLPQSAAAHLREAGWDAVHTFDMGLSRSSDQSILEYARNDQRTCITLDADFHALLAVSNARFPSVIRIRKEGLRGPELAQLLLNIWPRIEDKVQAGAMVTVTANTIRIHLLPIHKPHVSG